MKDQGITRLAVVRALGASISMLALTATGAMAQDAPAGSAGTSAKAGLEDIVVTAQFRAQKLQDTPLAITAIDSNLLESRSQTNLTDVANQAPSVQLRPQGASFGPSMAATIRGLGQADFHPAYEPGVGLYIDDVYYPRLTGANFDLLDVERVEILRGPQGTLTGRNSEGGAIKFITRKPTGEGGGFIEGTYGSRDRIGLRASADFTIADNLYGRLAGVFKNQKGYVKRYDYGCLNPSSGVAATRGGGDCLVSRHGGVGYQAIRGTLRFNPSEVLDLTVSADYVNDDRTNGAEVLLYANNANPNVAPAAGVPYDSRFICGRYCNYASSGQPAASFIGGLVPGAPGAALSATGGDDRSHYEGWGTSANAEITLSDSINLTSISAYREFKTRFNSDDDLSPANIGFGQNRLTDWFGSQELRLNAKVNSMIDLTVGGYYSKEKATYYTLQDIRYVPFFPLQFVGDDPVKMQSKAVFGTVIVKPTDSLTFTGGLRYTKESKAYTFYRYNLDRTTINPFLDPIGAAYGLGYSGADTLDVNGNGSTTDVVTALSGRTARFSGHRLDYRVSLDYRFSPEILAYATVATGFKGGGVGPRPFNAGQAVSFGPEKVITYELGLKTDLFDRKARINISAFHTDFKDAQLTLLSCPSFGGPGPCALPQNAGDAKLQGFEVEAYIKPVEGLSIDGSLSYLDWKWKCVNPAVVGGTFGPCSSDPAVVSLLSTPPIGVSKWKWSIGAQYEADLGNIGSLTPRIDAAYQGKSSGSALAASAGTPSAIYGGVPSYTIANARLTWRNADKDLDVSLEVTNLFDKYYLLTTFDLTGAGAGLIKGQPGHPREWALTVKKKF